MKGIFNRCNVPKNWNWLFCPPPIYPLKKLSAQYGKEIYIKRDDLTGIETSGNKIRKLEYALAEALRQGADLIITCGGIQSNHCRATAYAAAQPVIEMLPAAARQRSR